jgi:hypothetical protein
LRVPDPSLVTVTCTHATREARNRNALDACGKPPGAAKHVFHVCGDEFFMYCTRAKRVRETR